MIIRRPVLTACLLGIALFVTACSSSDSPPATTTPPPAASSNVVANAGSDQNVVVGSFITLNGSKSTTTNSNQLSYTWSMPVRPVGSTAKLSDPTIVNPTFTTDVTGTYECELVVSDGQETSSPAKVTITATAAGTNPQPVANAGPNRSVFIGKVTSLDGSASTDQIGDPLKYRWEFTDRPPLSAASLVNADKAKPSFTPDVAGPYVIRLVVNDGTSDSVPARVTITASTEPLPTAKAGLDQVVLPNSLVTLNGSESSDPGGDIPLKYLWSLTSPSGVTASLNNRNIANPTFTPSVAGAYTAQLIVTDSTGAKSAPDTVLITVGPRANAGPVQTVSVDATVQLNGSGSFGGSLRYFWEFTAPLVSGSPAGFSPNNTVVNPTFVANVAGTYMIKLTVTDSVGRPAIATTTVTAQAGPTANFSFAPPNPVVNTMVTLKNTSTGSSLAYNWELKVPTNSNSAAKFSNASATDQAFTADRVGDYDVKLTARNTSTNATHSKTLQITVNTPQPIKIPPTAKITVTTPLPANVCSTVKLDGTSSSDQDGNLASYVWTLTPPTGSGATLTISPTAAEFKADKAGTFGVSLVVTDNSDLQSSDAETITATLNLTGKSIYDNKVPGAVAQCSFCHKASSYDTTSAGVAPDLSDPSFDTGRISLKLKGGSHTGGKPSPELTAEQIEALRQFLNSTPCLLP